MVSCFGLFVWLAMLSLAAAEALPPDSIPALCAAICGPIVELSSMCSPKRSLASLESDLNGGTYPKRDRLDDGRIEPIEKHLTVIVAEPASFPSGLLGLLHSLFPPKQPASPLPPASWPSSSSSPPIPPSTTAASASLPLTMRPSVQPLPITSNPILRPAPTPTIMPNGRPMSSASVKKGMKTPDLATISSATVGQHSSMMPTVLGLEGDTGGETSGWGMTENAEEQCVCSNESFNVAEITGLCASCVGMIADAQNDVEVIMSVCGFPPQQYSPEKDSLASSIHVQAARPTANTGNAPRSIWGANVGLIAGAAGFVVGAIGML